MRTCKVCLLDKELDEFSKNSKYYLYKCKSCMSMYKNDYYVKNKEHLNSLSDQYNIINDSEIKTYKREWYLLNKEKVLDRSRNNYDNNKDIKIKYQKEYNTLNKEEINKKRRKYFKNRGENDPIYRLSRSIRSTIRNSIKRNGFSKSGRTHEILGCSFDEFKIYIESKFEHWMSWENYGLYNGELNYGWDIDHIICSSSAKNEGEIVKLNHYSNLQPLCSKINRDIKRNL